MISKPFIAILALAIFLTSAVASSGCGVESSTKTSTRTSATPADAGLDTGSEKPLPAPQPEPGQPAAAEQYTAYGPGSTGSQMAGTMIDGLELINVRFTDHGSFYRVVFDMGTLVGEPVLQTPYAKASLVRDGRAIRVELWGIRSIGKNPNAASSVLDTGDSLVTTIRRVSSGDDRSQTYEIYLSRPVAFTLTGLGSPGRIVIDINS